MLNILNTATLSISPDGTKVEVILGGSSSRQEYTYLIHGNSSSRITNRSPLAPEYDRVKLDVIDCETDLEDIITENHCR